MLRIVVQWRYIGFTKEPTSSVFICHLSEGHKPNRKKYFVKLKHVIRDIPCGTLWIPLWGFWALRNLLWDSSKGGRGDVAGIVTGLRVGESGFRVLARAKVFSVPQKLSDRIWGLRSLQFSGYLGSFLGVKRPELECDNSHQVHKLRMSGVIHLLPLYAFMA